MTTTTKSLKSPSPTTTTSRSVLFGAGAGAATALLASAGMWLSPLDPGDRNVLALVAVCMSLPLGVLVAGETRAPHKVALAGLCAALSLVTLLAIYEPVLWFRALVWCAAGTLIGGSMGAQHRAMGGAAAVFWLALCGLPFYAGSVPLIGDTAVSWAHGGCPWLGFSQDALGGDPLRRQVIYLGQLSVLTDEPAYGLLSAGTLWLAAALSLAILLARQWVPEKRPASHSIARPRND